MVLLLNNKRRVGFTLIELLVIIGIIGTLALIAGWQYKRTLNSQTLTNEALKISNIIQRERYKSIEQGTRRGIEFLSPDTMRIFRVNADLSLNYETREVLGKDFTFGNGGITIPLPLINAVPDQDGIMFGRGDRCEFNPNGMAVEEGAIIFTSKKFGTAAIVVSPTGIVNAYKWVNNAWAEVR